MSKHKTVNQNEERKMILQGFAYHEIANITKVSACSISDRNKRIYKIDLISNFRNNIFNKLEFKPKVTDSFGYWFSGYFDGEGCFKFEFLNRLKTKWTSTRLGVQIKIRKDDENVIDYIVDNIKVGNKHQCGRYQTSHSSVLWATNSIKDMYEVIVPIFEKYPLHTKKNNEFENLKILLKEKYICTLGGKSKFQQTQLYLNKFEELSKIVKDKRHNPIIV